MNEMLRCPRCSRPAVVEWLDASVLGDAAPCEIPGRIYCVDRLCVDRRGSRAVPLPPQPGELTVEDREWIDYHLDLARGRR